MQCAGWAALIAASNMRLNKSRGVSILRLNDSQTSQAGQLALCLIAYSGKARLACPNSSQSVKHGRRFLSDLVVGHYLQRSHQRRVVPGLAPVGDAAVEK